MPRKGTGRLGLAAISRRNAEMVEREAVLRER
jgi:hypothetical protein